MAGVDVAKRRKAFSGDTGWTDVTPHGTLSCGSGDVVKRLGGEKSSPLGRLLPAEPSAHQRCDHVQSYRRLDLATPNKERWVQGLPAQADRG